MKHLLKCLGASFVPKGEAVVPPGIVVAAAGGHHGGMLVVRYDSNPRNNMTASDIARAIRNLATASVPLRSVA